MLRRGYRGVNGGSSSHTPRSGGFLPRERRRAQPRDMMCPMDALAGFLQEFKRVAPAIVDSYFVVDRERRIVDFNRTFFAMLPRNVARGLKGKHCYEVIEHNICRDN